MGGVAKGLLQAPESEATLIERLLGEIARAAPGAEIVLVGDSTSYASLRLPTVDDAPRDIGPLGGLLGLLQHAEQQGTELALALACDLPRLDATVLERLLTADSGASALVVEQNGVRNPLIARYRMREALPAARAALAGGKRSLQAVLDRLADGVRPLPLTAAEAALVDDWDHPEDVRRG